MGLQAAAAKTYQHKKMEKAADAAPTLTAPAAAPGKEAAAAAAKGKPAAATDKSKGGKAAGAKKH